MLNKGGLSHVRCKLCVHRSTGFRCVVCLKYNQTCTLGHGRLFRPLSIAGYAPSAISDSILLIDCARTLFVVLTMADFPCNNISRNKTDMDRYTAVSTTKEKREKLIMKEVMVIWSHWNARKDKASTSAELGRVTLRTIIMRRLHSKTDISILMISRRRAFTIMLRCRCYRSVEVSRIPLRFMSSHE